MAGPTIYNRTDGPLIVDDEGHVLEGRTRRPESDVDSPPLADHIAANRIVIVEDPVVDEEPQAAASSTDATNDALTQAPTPASPGKSRGRRTSTTTTEEA